MRLFADAPVKSQTEDWEVAAPVAPARASSLCPSSCNRVPLGRRPSACRSPRASWQGQRGIDKTVWDTVPAQHDKRPHQKGRCEEVLSPVAAPHPWRPAIANADLIESFLWDILWDRPKNRVPKPTSRQAIALIVVNPPSTRRPIRCRRRRRFLKIQSNNR